MTKAINAITDENALNWFSRCGLFLEPIRLLIFVVDLMANSWKLKYNLSANILLWLIVNLDRVIND